MTDFETWLSDVGKDRVFRILVKRTPGLWTPYEMEKKYMDESIYENNRYRYVKIIEVIEMPSKDIMIGFKELYEFITEEEYEKQPICYYLLSQIELSYCQEDEEDFCMTE